MPAGFVHGFFTLSEHAEVLYKTTDFWSRDCECAIRWDDPQLAIPWQQQQAAAADAPLPVVPLLSDKDAIAPLLADLADQDVFS